METSINEIKEDKIDPAISGIKQKLGDARRRIKQIDLRETVVSNPLPAVGIGFAVGALVGLIRPMPHRGRISGALMGLVTGLAFRAVKTYAFGELATYAKQFIKDQAAPAGSNNLEGSKASYTPPF